jgi:hypothetical protein
MLHSNPPAFPRPHSVDDVDGDLSYPAHVGMTLRDYFAAKAMQGNLASMVEGQEFDPSMGAEWAYKVAEAMMEARNAAQ